MRGNNGETVTTANSKILINIALVLASVSAPAQEQHRRLWVLQEPDTIVEYDAATFAPTQTRKIPTEIFKSPQDLQINGKGQMLFLPAEVREPDGLVHENTGANFWFWDGGSGEVLQRPLTQRTIAIGQNKLVETAMPRCFLSADAGHLFWFENHRKTLMTEALDLSVDTMFRAWQTDLSGGQAQEIASDALPSCKCETGVCSESCPEVSFWIPEEGVSDFFFATHWTPGQIQPDYEDSFLYRRSVHKWSANKLPSVVEQILDSASEGTDVLMIEAVPDSGCCGWENVSDDQTLLTKNGKTISLFDEFMRYKNQDYDVSFFTSNAKLAPHAAAVAFTVMATQPAGTEIRLADSGKPNPGELSQIQKTLAELPVVEVVRVDDPAKPVAHIARATLVGWINDHEILMVENDVLVALDSSSGARRVSKIKMTRNSQAFLR